MWVPGQETHKAPSPPVPRTPVVNRELSAPAASMSNQFRDNFIAALAYFTFIPAIVLVLTEPYKRNRFIRFHSFQSIFLAVSTIVIAIAVRVLYSVLVLIPVLGFLLAWLSVAVVVLGWVILWLVLLVKALQGETFRLPWIGRLAEKV